MVDDESVGSTDTYTFENVIESHRIHATFTRSEHTITATAGENGTIDPEGLMKVPPGADQPFTIEAAPGYVIEDVLIDNESWGPKDSHIFEKVEQDHTIQAVFAEIPEVSLSLAGSPFAENEGQAIVSVTLDRTSINPVSVELTFGGTAVQDEDFQASELILTLPAGEIAASVTLTGIPDLSVEEDETVIVSLANVSGGIVGSFSELTAIITDDDELPSIFLIASDSSFAEAGGSVTVAAQLNRVADEDVTVSLSMAGTAVSGQDFDASPLSLTVKAGETEAAMILTGIDDFSVEGEETILLNIADVSYGTVGTPSEISVVIQDDDDYPTVYLSPTDFTFDEDRGEATVTAMLSQPVDAYVTIALELGEGGTAKAGEDFEEISLTLTLPPMETEAQITLTGMDDDAVEGEETILLSIVEVTNGYVGTPSAVKAVIQDDEQASVNLSLAGSPFDEMDGQATVTVTSSQAISSDITVVLNVGGTAVQGEDYEITPGLTLTIPAGETEAVLYLASIRNVEGHKSIILSIADVQGAVRGEYYQVTAFIQDIQTEDELIATHETSGGYEPGQELTITVKLDYTSTLTALRLEADLPEGWAYVSHDGDAAKQTGEAPFPRFEWVEEMTPESAVTFAYSVLVPEGIEGEKEIRARVKYTLLGEERVVAPDPLKIRPVNAEPEIEIVSCTQRDDGSGLVDIEFIGKDADDDPVTWYEPETYCLYSPGNEFDEAEAKPLNFPTDETMTFSSEGTRYQMLEDASEWPSGEYTIQLKVEDQSGHHVYGYSAPFQLDNSPPEIIGRQPDDVGGVALDTVITVTFSEEMKASTINGETFSVSGIQGEVTYGDKVATFTPREDLNFGEGYTVTLSRVTDMLGNPLADTWSFATEAAPADNNPPEPPVAKHPANEARLAQGTVTLELEEFSDPDGDEHAKTHWLLKRADGPMRVIKDVSSHDPASYHIGDLAPGLKYIWQADFKDERGGVSESSEMYAFKVGTREEKTVKVPAGEDESDFKMVSFVQWPDDPRPEKVLGDDMGGYNTTVHRIGTFHPASGGYLEYGRGLKEIKPGQAYWIFAKDGLEITVEGVLVSTSHDIEVELVCNLDVDKGCWNMIACPNDVVYDWNRVVVVRYHDDGTEKIVMPVSSSDNDLVHKKLWAWENGTYNYESEITEMLPNEGYWVKALQEDVFLRFPGSDRNEPSPEVGARRSRASASDYDDAPPAPMGYTGGKSSRVDENGGGCFVASLSDGDQGGQWGVSVLLLLSLGGALCFILKRW